MVHFEKHAFKGLDESLKGLFARLTGMGEQVQTLLDLFSLGLVGDNPDVFAKAKMVDKEINAAELENDKAVADILGKFRLMGEDLRFLLGSIKVAAALEHLADKVKNCSKRLSKIAHPLDAEISHALREASIVLGKMLEPGLKQVVAYQADVMVQLQQQERAIEQHYQEVVLRLRQLALDDEEENHLLFLSKNLDQAADIAVEIAKIGHYICLGEKYRKL